MITIYGASDDLVEIEGVDFNGRKGVAKQGKADEVYCYNQRVKIVVGADDPKASRYGCIVTMVYSPNDSGCWNARLSPIEEEIPCPFPVHVRFNEEPARGYSAIVEIDAPEGTPVRWSKVSEKRK